MFNTISRHCLLCKTPHHIKVYASDFTRWANGQKIQEAFPYLTAEDREILISGICGTCFDEIHQVNENEHNQHEEPYCTYHMCDGDLTDHTACKQYVENTHVKRCVSCGTNNTEWLHPILNRCESCCEKYYANHQHIVDLWCTLL